MSFEQNDSHEPSATPWHERAFSRRRLLQASGLAVAALAGGLAVPEAVSAASLNKQNGWRWCNRCQGLWFAFNGTTGRCPVGGGHSSSGSGGYALFTTNATVPYAEALWRWCSKCQGLWWGGGSSRCPAGGAHSSTGSGNYSISMDVMVQPGQNAWRWCNRCQGLFFNHSSLGFCPAGGAHTNAGSPNYCVLFEAGNPSISSFSMLANQSGYWVKATGSGFVQGPLSIFMEHPVHGSIGIAGASVNASGNFSIDQSTSGTSTWVRCTTLRIAGTSHNQKTHLFRFTSGGTTAYATAYVSC